MIREDVIIGANTKIWQPDLVNLFGCRIGENCNIGAFVEIGSGVTIGNNCKIQAFCYIPEGIVIGNNVFLGPRVTFTNDKYPPSSKDIWKEYKTIIEDGASIGAGSTILPGISIGKNAKIGAGSVVTKDVKSNDLVYGNPARSRL